jgi:hypothetical protein
MGEERDVDSVSRSVVDEELLVRRHEWMGLGVGLVGVDCSLWARAADKSSWM